MQVLVDMIYLSTQVQSFLRVQFTRKGVMSNNTACVCVANLTSTFVQQFNTLLQIT